jgi:hypothetical protein
MREQSAWFVRRLLSVTLCVTALGSGAAWGQTSEAPSGESIMDKYVDATGGKAAYEKIRNRVMEMTLDIPAAGLKGKMTVYSARPNLTYAVTDLDQMGKSERGTDGKVAWEISQMMGPRVMDGDEAAITLREGNFDTDVNWRKHYTEVKCIGEESVNETACYRVVLTPTEGPAETRFFDKATGLVVKSEMTLKTQMGAVPIESFVSEYREVDGIQVPHKVRQVVGRLQEINIQIESIKHNQDIPEEKFKLPEVIRQLVEKQKAGKKDEAPAEK